MRLRGTRLRRWLRMPGSGLVGLEMGETPEWDAVSARICKLEMPTASEVMDLFGAYGKLLIERDALADELKAVKAGLPRWRDEGVWRCLRLGPLYLGTVKSVDGQHTTWTGIKTRCHNTREAAMLAVTEALGLAPCEVEGE